jgi:NADPH:quinone reductase-like Zn-dependent oxidoreductase
MSAAYAEKNVELIRSLGADRVMNYTRENFMKGARRYDVILDALGTIRSRHSGAP